MRPNTTTEKHDVPRAYRFCPDRLSGPYHSYKSAQLPHYGSFRTAVLIDDDPASGACLLLCRVGPQYPATHSDDAVAVRAA